MTEPSVCSECKSRITGDPNIIYWDAVTNSEICEDCSDKMSIN